MHLHPAGSLQELLLALAPSPLVSTTAAGAGASDATAFGLEKHSDGRVDRPSSDGVASPPPVAAAGRPTLLQKLLRKKDYERVSAVVRGWAGVTL